MQLSAFEEMVLSAIIETDPERGVLEKQLCNATVTNRDHTGVGLYTKRAIDPDTPRLATTNRYIEETPKLHLCHPRLPAGAGGILWLSDGRADTLECYTYEGAWPEDESSFSISRPSGAD